jgi:hypothetical protein
MERIGDGIQEERREGWKEVKRNKISITGRCKFCNTYSPL